MDIRPRHFFFLAILSIALSVGLHAQTLSIVNPASPPPLYQPGAVIPLNITKAALGTSAAFQFDLALSAGTFTAAPGPALPSSKFLSCSSQAGGATTSTCLAAGINQDVIADGVVAIITVTLPAALTSSPVNVVISNPVAADKDGSGLPVSLGNPSLSLSIRSGCDVNGDGSTGSADFSAAVNAVLNRQNTVDLNKDSKTNVLDVQIVATAATPPAFTCNAK